MIFAAAVFHHGATMTTASRAGCSLATPSRLVARTSNAYRPGGTKEKPTWRAFDVHPGPDNDKPSPDDPGQTWSRQVEPGPLGVVLAKAPARPWEDKLAAAAVKFQRSVARK